MALANKKLIGTWNTVPGSVFQSRTFDNGATFYLVQVVSEFPDAFIVRGRDLTANNFTKASGITTEEVDVLADSDPQGLTTPTAFTTPTGYVKKFTTDGTPYYANSDDLVGDTNGDGVVDENDQPRSANLLTQVTDWVKANPILSAAIAVGVYLFILKPMMGGKKKKGLLALL